MISYNGPVILFIEGDESDPNNATANLPALGAFEVIVQAGNLGIKDFSHAARVGHTACEATEWQSDISLVCNTARGAKETMRLAITVGVEVGSVTEAVSYDAPTLSSVLTRNLVTVGGVDVVLFGESFALDAYSGGARIGQTGCEASAWASDTSLACKTAGGVFATLRVIVTAGGRAGSASHAVSYDVPMLAGGRNLSDAGDDENENATSFSRTNSPSTGSVSMTVVGLALGRSDYTGASRVGSTACEASGWDSDSSLRCLSSGGLVATLRVAVTAGIRAGSVTEGLSFDVPMLDEALRANTPSTGAVSLTVLGSNLAHSAYSPAARLAATACEASAWESDSSVRCLTAGGAFATARVAVTAGARAGSMTEATSYDTPQPGHVVNDPASPDNSTANGSPSGGAALRVTASGLGVQRYSHAARVGASACEATRWESDSSIFCTAPRGAGATLRVAITVGARAGSLTEAVSYDLPVLSSVANTNKTTYTLHPKPSLSHTP